MQWETFQEHVQHLSKRDMERLKEAFTLGENVHKDQKRKSGEPYFTHPIAVTIMLADLHADADTMVAGLLHDSVEDTDLTFEEIDTAYDGSVTSLIDGVTKLSLSDLQGNPSLDQKIETLRKIFTSMEKDVRTMVIKLVDRLHNMQTVSHFPEKKQKSYAQETLDTYVKIADRLCLYSLRIQLEGLCLQVLEPKLHAELCKQEERNTKQGKKIIPSMEQQLKNVKAANVIGIHQEPKTWQKLRTQIETKGAVSGIADQLVTVVCPTAEDCYAALGALHQLWRREHLSFQDFINSPMMNGYRGLHTTIILEDGTRVRCKIRSEEMHAYAMNGIATLCFDNEAKGLLDYVPWAKHIAPLSQDTVDHSEDFYESLQSDILGNAIVIHAIDDQAILTPEDSTVLDGIFYCYSNKALWVKTAYINGKEVPLSHPLRPGVSLTIEVDKTKQTLKHQWLLWANTGLATAAIRRGLADLPQKKNESVGKELLEQEFALRRHGFLAEFSKKSIQEGVTRLGYKKLKHVFQAIGEGRLDPNTAYDTIVEKHPSPNGDHRTCTVEYTFPLDNPTIKEKLQAIRESHYQSSQSIQFTYDKEQKTGKAKVIMQLTPEQQNSVIADLERSGATGITIRPTSSKPKFIFGITILILLWGLDPVYAYKLIHLFDVSALDMTLIRFWTLTVVSAIMLGWRQYKIRLTESLLPLRSLELWASVVLLVSTAYATYAALQSTLPSHYTIPMTATGVIVSGFVRKHPGYIKIFSWGMLLIGTIILAVYTNWPTYGIIMTALAVIAFTSFSFVSEDYKRSGKIEARADQYFFVLSFLCSVVLLPLIPSSTLSSIPSNGIMSLILFAIIFAGLPYYIYYFMLSRRQYDFMLRYSFLLIISTTLGQAVLIGSVSNTILLSGFLVTLGGVLPMVFRKS